MTQATATSTLITGVKMRLLLSSEGRVGLQFRCLCLTWGGVWSLSSLWPKPSSGTVIPEGDSAGSEFLSVQERKKSFPATPLGSVTEALQIKLMKDKLTGEKAYYLHIWRPSQKRS